MASDSHVDRSISESVPFCQNNLNIVLNMLEFACEIVAELRKINPEIQFVIVGCAESEIKHLFKRWSGGVEILGWIAPLDFVARIDLLIHPARNEPSSIVIAEVC
ncbi:glycosyltransferase [Candidatus Spongiihabitans sp.]|uniref:glycosyltransferase family 4 protein n=1 Tax=Candidatus Spongiihabitans sp. TaxID=3101308 RepID=UPI003C700DAC